MGQINDIASARPAHGGYPSAGPTSLERASDVLLKLAEDEEELPHVRIEAAKVLLEAWRPVVVPRVPVPPNLPIPPDLSY